MVEILIADKQPLFRAGLAHLLADIKDFKIVKEIDNKRELDEELARFQPAVLVIDYYLDTLLSSDDFQKIKQAAPNTKILIVSSGNDKDTILQILQEGIKGYLTKDCSKEEVVKAIYAVASGQSFYCSSIYHILMERHLNFNTIEEGSSVLTPREKEILGLIAKGNSTIKIAEILSISRHTINTHRKNIIRKLNIKSPTEFVIHAIDLGIIHLYE